MSEQTNDLLNLFSKLLRNPKFMMAMHVELMRSKLRNPGNRKGAQGLLIELWKQDGLTNAEIAELLDIKPSSVTAQVNQLSEAGLVERRTDEKDGRVSRVFLTESGKSAQKEHREHYDEISEDIFAGLTDEEQQQLKVLIQKLIDLHAGEDWDWEKFTGPAGFHDFGPGFNPREMHRAMNDLRRAGHDFKHDLRRQMRAHGDLGEFGNWGFGPNPRNKSKNEDEKWDDF
ncbi:MarR family winged helix-turn-helix transcriptional regulator [Lactovum odontotermitis]